MLIIVRRGLPIAAVGALRRVGQEQHFVPDFSCPTDAEALDRRQELKGRPAHAEATGILSAIDLERGAAAPT